MNVIESIMNVFSGERAKQHQRYRGILAFRDAQLKVLSRVVNTGYSHGGAARRKPWVKGWRYRSKSPKSDIEQNRKTLRERSRDLSMNSPIGAAAVNSTRTNAVGCGLVPKPKIDYELLNISREEARNLEKKIRQEFKIWAESTLCDVADQNNFYELQQIAFSDWLRNGEEFALISYEKEATYMPYQLRLRLIEGDRISTPGSLSGEYFQDKKLETGNTIMNGVEITKQGKVVRSYLKPGYEKVEEFIEKGYIDRQKAGKTRKTTEDLEEFAKGEYPFMITGAWAAGRVEEMNLDFEFQVHPLPVLENSNVVVVNPDVCLAVNAVGKHTEEARRFVDFLTRKDNIERFSQQRCSLSPLKNKKAPGRKQLSSVVSCTKAGRIVVAPDNRLELPLNDYREKICRNILGGMSALEAVDQVLTN